MILSTISFARFGSKHRYTLRTGLLVLLLIVVDLWGTTVEHPVLAVADPKCLSNAIYPNVNPDVMCAELLLDKQDAQGMAAITALTFDPSGVLYYASPATSQILRMVPDGTGFFKAPEVFADKLPEPPNGLTYNTANKTWYVSADTTITALTQNDPGGVSPQVLVKGLPGQVGGWLGNIHIGPDNRIYVAKASSCDHCIEADPRRAALLSFAIDGSDPQVVAHGLRDSYDFDWSPDGTLYIVDNERANFRAELNVIPKGTPHTLDFGWPRCAPDGKPVAEIDGATADYCAQTQQPLVTFSPDSHPTGIVYYSSDAFPHLKNSLIVALSGSWNATTTAGYGLWVVTVTGQTAQVRREIPNINFTEPNSSITETSFFPYHVICLTVSPEGWLYASTREGRIYRFRPTPKSS